MIEGTLEKMRNKEGGTQKEQDMFFYLNLA